MACSARTASRIEPKPDGETGAERRQRKQFQRRLGDDAQQPFRADEQPVQLEAGLVLVRAPAQPQHGAVGQHDFQAEHVIAGDAVFEAARAAGVGDDVAADGIRAALCHDELTAQMSRRHNNANVLCLASDVLGDELIRRIVVGWLDTPFDGGGRHERRVRKIAWIEQGKDPSTYNEKDGLVNNHD